MPQTAPGTRCGSSLSSDTSSLLARSGTSHASHALCSCSHVYTRQQLALECLDCATSQVLGVPLGAADADVRRRFRQMAPRVHPDKCRLPRAEDAFTLLNTAVTRLLLQAHGYAHSCSVRCCLWRTLLPLRQGAFLSGAPQSPDDV